MNNLKELFRVILAVSIIIVGVTHFTVPDQYAKIVPPQLPYPVGLVYLSGFYEILGGIGLLVPPVSQAAAWGLIALFIAVFPANINMAVNHIKVDNIPDSNLLQAVRLPFQAVFIAWAWWYTKPTDLEKQASIIPKSFIPKQLKDTETLG
ncbi:MAG: DoxX family protein [Stigonema ocellatum SAG 48.90 = DSM 106950]|nr:DoxX family protein [Stigonema ocellatum SAG 48.90 = DSM 106950]